MHIIKIIVSSILVFLVSIIIASLTTNLLNYGTHYYYDVNFRVDGPGWIFSLGFFWLGNILVFTYVGLRLVIPKLKKKKHMIEKVSN